MQVGLMVVKRILVFLSLQTSYALRSVIAKARNPIRFPHFNDNKKKATVNTGKNMGEQLNRTTTFPFVAAVLVALLVVALGIQSRTSSVRFPSESNACCMRSIALHNSCAAMHKYTVQQTMQLVSCRVSLCLFSTRYVGPASAASLDWRDGSQTTRSLAGLFGHRW